MRGSSVGFESDVWSCTETVQHPIEAGVLCRVVGGSEEKDSLHCM